MRWVLIKDKLPSHQNLWRSVYKREQLEKDGTLKPGFFKDKRGLSSDLSILSKPQKSRRGYSNPPAWPEESGLIEFTIHAVRKCSRKTLDVKHHPMSETKNYSHTIFTGPASTEQARNLIKKSKWINKASFPSND